MTDKSDGSINWLEKSIASDYLNYYEYSNFKNIQPIGCGAFGRVCRANWKDTDNIFSLKSFHYCESTLKEVVKEVLNMYNTENVEIKTNP